MRSLALLLDVPLGAIEIAVAATGAPPGRFESVDAGQPFHVIVDYAHKPDALENVLRAAHELAKAGDAGGRAPGLARVC